MNPNNQEQYKVVPVPFHKHTGSDSPAVPFLNLSDVPKSYSGKSGTVATVNSTETGLVFSASPKQNLFSEIDVAGQTTVTANSPTTALTLVAGTSITLTTDNTAKSVTIASSGGGGSPGGSNQDVQFNDSSAFGGQNTFKFSKATTTVTLDNGGGAGVPSTIDGGISDLDIITDDDAGSACGSLLVAAGSNSNATSSGGSAGLFAGDATASDGTPGAVTITAGKCGSPGSPPFLGTGTNPGGSVLITAGSTGHSTGGNIVMNSGSAKNSSGVSGNIQMTIGTGSGAGSGFILMNGAGGAGITPNVAISNTTTPTFGSGQGVIFIANAGTTPSTNPSGGGILYVTGGALTYLGSGGTVTILASA